MKKIIAICFSILLFLMSIPVSASTAENLYFEEQLARDLKTLGLFQGVSDTDFALNRAPTRPEALVMLLRLMGAGVEAQNSTALHPFTDVPDWANAYVGYAYQNGLTNGVSPTEFGVGQANAQVYLTFVLRALGYTDVNGADFTWDNPFSLAKSVGILPEGVDRENFLREDVVLVSYAALQTKLKDSEKTLAQKLMENGLFTEDTYEQVYDATAIEQANKNALELTLEEFEQKYAPAVFYIELYNRAGESISSGNGFFLEETGVAVTNFHVIENGYSAQITLPATDQVYDVVGVYDYNVDYDWALIQVNGTGFSTLNIGDENRLTAGETVYAVGSSTGDENAVLQGTILEPKHWGEKICYIKTDAPVSPGICGGALLNRNGEVVGITDGTNADLMVPISVLTNHLKESITPLADIARTMQPETEGEHTPREEAFALLLAVIDTLENETINDKPAYTKVETVEGGPVEYTILRNDDHTIDVITWKVYQGSASYTSLTLEPYSDRMFVFYSYNQEGDSSYYTGLAEISAPEYEKETAIRFTESKGNAKRSTHEDICRRSVAEGLDFVQRIFDEFNELGNYSVSDLGFLKYE